MIKNQQLFLLNLLIICSLTCLAQAEAGAWNKEKEGKHLANRQDSTTWDKGLLQTDIQKNKERGIAKPLAYGAFPVPRYELLGTQSFKGVGAGGNFNGINLEGKKLVYAYFLVNKNVYNQEALGEKPNEVFFTIVVLTDFIDTINFSHIGIPNIISRNNPHFIGEGLFKTRNDEIDYTAFITADREQFAIVNMRLFNLKFGRTILIAPHKDGSLRSMQINSPVFSDKEVENYIGKLVQQEEVKVFFTNAETIY